MVVPPVNVTFADDGVAYDGVADHRAAAGQHRQQGGGQAGLSSAWSMSRASASDTSGVHSAGLRTTALPAASAGAIFCASLATGEFHGAIAPTTPIGS